MNNCDFCGSNKNVKTYNKHHRHYGYLVEKNSYGNDTFEVESYNMVGEFTPKVCSDCAEKYFRPVCVLRCVTALLTTLIVIFPIFLLDILSNTEYTLGEIAGILVAGIQIWLLFYFIVRFFTNRVYWILMGIPMRYYKIGIFNIFLKTYVAKTIMPKIGDSGIDNLKFFKKVEYEKLR